MKIKQKIVQFGFTGLFILGISILGLTAPAFAQEDEGPKCGGVSTAIIQCDQSGEGGDVEDTGLWGILLLVINILTAAVGVAAVAGVVYGSVLYASAGGSADQTKKAMGIITNVVIGVIAYALMVAFLNFIIPGGVFNT